MTDEKTFSFSLSELRELFHRAEFVQFLYPLHVFTDHYSHDVLITNFGRHNDLFRFEERVDGCTVRETVIPLDAIFNLFPKLIETLSKSKESPV